MRTQYSNFSGFFALWLASSLLFTQCNSSNNSSSTANNSTQDLTTVTDPNAPINNAPNAPIQLAVRPPFANVNVPMQNYKVSAQKGGKIQVPTGTTIDIPANAFVDKDGKPITGEVQIEYREFHTAAEIMASGIPMHNPETGQYMESAGMFEIKGSQNGQEIFVKDDAKINIKMASFKDGEFDFFALNPKDCRWADVENEVKKPGANNDKALKMRELDKKTANMPVQPSKEGATQNFVFDLDVNYQRFPELKTFKNVVWEYVGSNEATNPEKQKWVFEVDWDKINLEKDAVTQNFILKLETNNNSKSFSTEVRPVLSKEDYAKGMADFDKKMTEYKKIKTEVEIEAKRLAVQADLLREFGVNGFGIYNWDIWKDPARTKCEAEFTFDDKAKINPEINQNIVYYLVSPATQTLVQFNAATLKSFSFNPSITNVLVAVLPNNQVATFSANDFKGINATKLGEGVKQKFALKTHSSPIKSVTDIQKIIDNLS